MSTNFELSLYAIVCYNLICLTWHSLGEFMSETSTDSQQWMEIRGVCPHDCPDTCTWIATVDRITGQVVHLRGAEDHPITRGFLCPKVNHYLERTYHPGRLLYPMRRVGAKGEGRFKRISWEAALQEISERLRGISDRYGPEAILPYSYAGTMGLVQGQSMDRRFFHKLGATRLLRTICSSAGLQGLLYTLGTARGTPPEDFRHARYIILWGANLLTSNVHQWPFVREAQKRGARYGGLNSALADAMSTSSPRRRSLTWEAEPLFTIVSCGWSQ